ncbi:MAG: L-serine ammonia-lyase, partial [Flavobacteriaceae bacterium]|nr:L-serine ammonia-lyase [Flavobacteriaceae bacterium]
MESISIFDMLKIGVGPSSSHTLGPWRAAERWLKELKSQNNFDEVNKIKVDLYGSLSLTGKGHATDLAILLGLSGADPESIPVDGIASVIDNIKSQKNILLNNEKNIDFDWETDIVFNRKFLPFHANALC